jgi:hypothetical protein
MVKVWHRHVMQWVIMLYHVRDFMDGQVFKKKMIDSFCAFFILKSILFHFKTIRKVNKRDLLNMASVRKVVMIITIFISKSFVDSLLWISVHCEPAAAPLDVECHWNTNNKLIFATHFFIRIFTELKHVIYCWTNCLK